MIAGAFGLASSWLLSFGLLLGSGGFSASEYTCRFAATKCYHPCCRGNWNRLKSIICEAATGAAAACCAPLIVVLTSLLKRKKGIRKRMGRPAEFAVMLRCVVSLVSPFLFILFHSKSEKKPKSDPSLLREPPGLEHMYFGKYTDTV